MTLSRRSVLGTVATAAASLAGCGSRAGNSDVATLPTVDVAGSPGESLAIRPPDEPALLDFFATWCAPCKPQMAELRTVRDRFPELHLLSVTREEDTAAIGDFWREYDGTWPVATDPNLESFQRYDVTGIPTKVVIDTDGMVTWRHTGLAAADTIADQIESVVQ